jgi:Holliday junction resolvase-like predicted endonuclease
MLWPTSKTNYAPLDVAYPVLDALKIAFPQLESNNCLETSTGLTFYIYDHETEKRCYAHNDPDGIAHFTVINNEARSVHFLAIDKCLLMDSDENSRCDCAVFDEQTVCFIEIKTTSSENERRRTKLRRKAMEQLKATIVYFKNQAVFDSADIEAYVTLLAESEGRPRNRTNLAAEIEEFEEMGVRLFYANAKAFL